MGLKEWHFQTYNRVLNRAAWSSLAASRILLQLPVARLCLRGPLIFGLNDTVERRWGGRFAALGLSVMNVVAVISLSEIAPAALQQHITWGVLLAMLAVFGSGSWSADGLLVKPWLRRLGWLERS